MRFAKGMNDFDEWSTNCLANFVMIDAHVHRNKSRFTLSLIHQQQRGVTCSEVHFVTKTNTECFMEVIKKTTCMSAATKQC